MYSIYRFSLPPVLKKEGPLKNAPIIVKTGYDSPLKKTCGTL